MLRQTTTRGLWIPIFASWLGVVGSCHAVDRITVGGEAGYAPYETLDSRGRPVGFNVDLMRAVARSIDAEAEFRLGAWEDVRQELQSGEIDVLGMFVSERRDASVDFAQPHIIVHHRIFIPAGSEPIHRIEDLAGRTVIVQREAWSHEYLANRKLDVDLTLVDTDAEGLELLARGEHDAALLTEHRSRHTLRESRLDNLTVSGPPVLPVEYAMAVREGNRALLEQIDSGLQGVMASGEFDRIYERWLQPFDGDQATMSPGSRALIIGAIVILAVLIAGLCWKMLRYRRDMRAAERQIAYLRDHDALTGLLSRHTLEHRLARMCRTDSGGPHCLLDINVDQFRVVNERLGHARADQLLQALGARMREVFPAQALVARQSADDFAVLLPETGEETATALGQALLTSLEEEALGSGQSVRPITLSVGVASFDDSEDDYTRVVRHADCACLAAKEDGGNQVHVWHPDDQRLAEKYGELAWVARIQQALGEDRMVLFWQPIVPVGGPPFRTVSIEILVRMLPEATGEDDTGEVITAARFMPAAERYFMTTQIDRWVVTNTLEWMESHPKTVQGLERVNVNLSGRSLGDQRFLEFLDRAFRRHARLLPRLCLEVTETALISNLDQVRQLLERLHRAGCRVALDDFGTGVSSMSYLRQLPVDYVKVDGSFVKGIDRDPSAFEFISEINRLGQAMGKITVAECVETEAVHDRLREAGFDLMQGYLIGRPAPLDELTVHLARPARAANTSY